MSADSSIFFPEKMQHVELVVPLDSASSTIRILANHNLIHLIDKNFGEATPNRRYLESFVYCEEAERYLAFIGNQLSYYQLLPEPISLNSFNQLQNDQPIIIGDEIPRLRELNDSLHERISHTQQLEGQLRLLQVTISALRFFRPLLKERKDFMQPGESDTEKSTAFELELLSHSFLHSITGIIDSSKLRKLLVTFHRISRGNVFISTGSVEDDSNKSFFTVWFQTESIMRKITTLASSYGAEVFEFPVDDNQLDRKEIEVGSQIDELQVVIQQSYVDNRNFLESLKGKYWQNKLFFLREKQMYQYMDFADYTAIEDRAIYRGWVPTRRLHELQPLLEQATSEAGSAIHTTVQLNDIEESPPTLIETNDFTASFQIFNDSYGVANYDEVNGGAFYAMYPFLFGIMFGDVGHSFMYLLISLALIYFYPKLSKQKGNELFESLLGFRYFMLMMSICGIYSGLVYNDWFGLPVNLFGSHYQEIPVSGNHTGTTIWNKTDSKVYPFGVDPVWLFKDNELIFLNSMKMKLSVVMGIIQMIFGMILCFVKHYRRKHYSELFLAWLPQLLYLLSFFGYMVIIIIKKWFTQFPESSDGVNLIQVLISMFLSPSEIKPDQDLYPGQLTVQNILALIFVSTIPFLLFVKPIVEIATGHGHGGVLEVLVMNLIEVIEFCLSALSHTASYLRLWALSLAHSQLSHVLYEQLFKTTLETENPLLLLFGWAAYAVMSVIILLGMECFSSLLHAIRLMWVEFSSKFYTGQGYPFTPLSFKNLVKSFGISQ